ncbi:TPA: hypothetical protein ACGF8X_002247 [Vibrio cholerae]|nr:WD40 repeat domain-containing protein [Vibrio cholerae]
MSFKKIDSFALSHDNEKIYAGNFAGELLIIDTSSFSIEKRIQLHMGSIHVVSIHESLPYVATLGKDGNICILKVTDGKVSLIHKIVSRNIRPEGDQFEMSVTSTQALTFHPNKPQLASAGGTSGLFEVTFSDETYEVLHCTRFHGGFDFITARYCGSGDELLTCTNRGHVYKTDGDTLVACWNVGRELSNQAHHWFEHIENNEFFIASDGRCVIRFDSVTGAYTVGELFAIDHMEHVTKCKTTGKIYASGFCKRIFEINPEDLSVVRVVFKAPFKFRWIKVLNDSPDIMIAQSRNGILYKLSVSTGEVIDLIKETPFALWSADAMNKSIYIGGEGAKLFRLDPESLNAFDNKINFSVTSTELPINPDDYIKRLSCCEATNEIALGLSTGQLLIIENDEIKFNVDLGSNIRDLDFSYDGKLYICCEDGSIYRFVQGDLSLLLKRDMPAWALSISPNGQYLAVADRIKNVFIFNTLSDEVFLVTDSHRFTQRINWVDDETFLASNSSKVIRYNLKNGLNQITHTLISDNWTNTVEDFAWDKNKNYLFTINYTKQSEIYDFTTSENIASSSASFDYLKGVYYLEPERFGIAYTGDFLTFGRDGVISYNRIHDETIVVIDRLNLLNTDSRINSSRVERT